MDGAGDFIEVYDVSGRDFTFYLLLVGCRDRKQRIYVGSGLFFLSVILVVRYLV